MEPFWTGIAGQIGGILERVKTPLAVTGLIVIVAGYFATRSIEPDQIAIQVVIGALGIDFLIFGLAFNTISFIESRFRPGYVITLFSIFSGVTLVILGMVIYLLAETSKVALLPVPPISAGSPEAVIPLPARELSQTAHASAQFDASSLQSVEGSYEREFFEWNWRHGYPPHSKKEKPKFIRFAANAGVNFQIGGFVWDKGAIGRFAIVASGGGPYTVEKLYVKLHKFADCPLRDEYSETQAPTAFPGYAFYISKDVNLYEIVPRTGLGEVADWKLENGEYDEFQIRFVYEPYVLFIVSVEADVVRRSDGAKSHIATSLLPLLRVQNGNAGGCLTLSNWYSLDLLQNPQQRSYSSLVGDLALYQILSSDGASDRNFLKSVVDTVPSAQVREMLPRLTGIANKNRLNIVFKENINWLQKLLAWKTTNSSTEPP